MKNMINRLTGHIKINETLIKANDLKDDIASYHLGEFRDEQDMKTGWTWLTENNILVDSKYFNLSFAFFEDRLRGVNIVFQDNKFDFTNGWDSWSEEEELQSLNQFKIWLNQEVGAQENFDWGTALAVYDSKGGSSSIVIQYK
jgi:hypothetical protein